MDDSGLTASLKIGYARTSQDDSDIERQIGDLLAVGVPAHLIFRDEMQSGAKPPERRPGYAQMLKLIETGAVGELYMTDLFRLGRDARGTLQELWSLQDKHVKVHSFNKLDQVVLAAPPELQPVLQAAVLLGADLQRKKAIDDTKSGLARARAKGKRLGRPPVVIDPAKVKFFTDKGLSEHAAFLAAGYKRTTFYRWKRAQKEKPKNGVNAQ